MTISQASKTMCVPSAYIVYGPAFCAKKRGVDILHREGILGSMTTKRKKKFTVGLWMDLKTPADKSNLQMWSIQKGQNDGKNLQWFTVVEAVDEDEALRLGQNIYSGKVPIVEQDKAAEAA